MSNEHKPEAVRQPSPSRIDGADQDNDVKQQPQPPQAGSEAAMIEQRKTQPSRNRGVTNI
ncbi:hypothetical protein GT347_09820 [Xylophilus rhododendri]|uniref:Uncharacterized protein n=1 Tax=Xylophilus rhododendri TaxID=2697032 RepID=A0A857J5Z9_9BURK|nr:hypothetical protein [Xylophilus rhododendri]QHI98265.1 hypothetical protein GT347_09820 [Xylophilus rhododendri]